MGKKGKNKSIKKNKKCIFKSKKIKLGYIAFTLLELIITVTLLVILMTIWFIMFIWMLKDSRDSVRIDTLWSMNFALETFWVEKWYYPTPDNAKIVAYSWSALWYQWTFWDDTFQLVWIINKKPVDPMTQSEYAYSVLNNKKAIELWTVIEWDNIARLNVTPKTYAVEIWSVLARSYVKWNYNWQVLRTTIWDRVYVISMPTIITNNLSSSNIDDVINNKNLSYKWYFNLPESYSWTIFNINWWFDYTPNLLVIYTWSLDDLKYLKEERIKLLSRLQDSYRWTLLDWDKALSALMRADIDLSNPTQVAYELSNNLVWNKLDIYIANVFASNTYSSSSSGSWSWTTSAPEYETFDITNGLLDNDTRNIIQDSSWDMWFATKQWVNELDWSTLYDYNAPDLWDDNVRDLLQDSSWNMWFATKDGVTYYDWTNWITYDISDWVIDDENEAIYEDSSWNIWVATKKWVSFFDWSVWTSYDESDWLIEKEVIWIVEDNFWNMWFSTKDWISKFDWTTWTDYTEADWLVDKNLLSTYKDSLWNLWFWTINWVSKFDWTTWTNYDESDWLVDKFVQAIAEDSDWNMWFWTIQWASKFDWTNWVTLDESDWLPDQDVQAIYEDAAWNMWFWTKMWVTVFYK